jgi:hypothetical protein
MVGPTGVSASSESGTAPGTEPPADPDSDGPVVGAPINIPPFTITGQPLDVTKTNIAQVVAEACGQATPCVQIVYEVVDPEKGACRIDRVSPPETVERGGTLTVFISCQAVEDTTDETTDETTSAEQTTDGEES